MKSLQKTHHTNPTNSNVAYFPKASKATSASLVDYLNGKADQYLLNYTIKTATIETIDETT